MISVSKNKFENPLSYHIAAINLLRQVLPSLKRHLQQHPQSLKIMDSNLNDDLYGDLNLTLDNKRGEKSKSSKNPTTNISGKYNTASSTTRYTSGTNRNFEASSTTKEKDSSLLQKIKLLEEENLRLKRNIGTLFRTAKNEIQRKDNQIERLQNQLEKQS